MTAMLKSPGYSRASARRPGMSLGGQLAPVAPSSRWSATPRKPSPWEPQPIAQFPPVRSPLAPQPQVRVLSKPGRAPSRMSWLASLQRGSTALSFVLVSAVLGVYSWTVYTQHVWGQEYERLEQLQDNERKLVSANEMLKNELAQQAEQPNAGFVPPTLDQSIFLEPAPPRPPVMPAAAPASAPVSHKPLGY